VTAKAKVPPKIRPAKPPLRIPPPLRPYAASLAAVGVLALVLLEAAPSLLLLTLLPAGAVLGIAADRLRMHAGWHRRGGKAALRKRRRYQGPAPLAELARNLPAGQGVPIGTVRKASW
jgi:hypothetical protein